MCDSRDKYGQDYFTLRSSYFQGRPPKSVNLHFRRFKISTIPYNDSVEFEKWVRERWIEKDDLLEVYQQTGRLPSQLDQGILDTAAKLHSILELLRMFAVLGCVDQFIFMFSAKNGTPVNLWS